MLPLQWGQPVPIPGGVRYRHVTSLCVSSRRTRYPLVSGWELVDNQSNCSLQRNLQSPKKGGVRDWAAGQTHDPGLFTKTNQVVFVTTQNQHGLQVKVTYNLWVWMRCEGREPLRVITQMLKGTLYVWMRHGGAHDKAAVSENLGWERVDEASPWATNNIKLQHIY